MTIRTYLPGDEVAQVSIYNEAAGSLPKFKPATVDEVRRRIRAADFDPGSRLYAIEEGNPVGYVTLQPNGRISYPWCRLDKEQWAIPLLERVLAKMKRREMPRAWAAYRGDWTSIRDFFIAQQFEQKREIFNFVLDLIEMPTPAASATTQVSQVTPNDVQSLKDKAGDVLRASLAEIEQGWFRNSWFTPASLFALRSRSDNHPVAVGALILNSSYPNPKHVDSAMPCFRLGAFGSEGLTTKRINGLFSFIVTEPRDTSALGLDLLNHAARLMQDVNGETVAAQVSSDVPHLVRFYRQYFRQQGSFPLFERPL
jgi:hypothetical protein